MQADPVGGDLGRPWADDNGNCLLYTSLLRLPVDTAGEAVSLNDSGDLT